jgi:hypothetical protein
MNLRHAAALALGCALLSGCWAEVKEAALTADDPCRSVTPGGSRITTCEQLRAVSNKNALLDDYRKCVDANAKDPTRCSAILQGLNAYSVNVGENQTPTK